MIKFEKGKAYKDLVFGFSPLVVKNIVPIDENSNRVYNAFGESYSSQFINGVEIIDAILTNVYYRADRRA